MTNTTEALKMAIETIRNFKLIDYEMAEKSINACKEALKSQEPPMPKNCRPLEEVIAEYEQDPSMKKALDEARIRLREYMSQEQEPVFICKKCGDDLGIVYEPEEPSLFGWYDNHDIYNEKQTDDSIPLYTHPCEQAHAQPLSDDEITNLEADSYVKTTHDTWEFDVYSFARAIEAAHGIK